MLNKTVFICERTNVLINTAQYIKCHDIKIIELQMLINNINNITSFGIQGYFVLPTETIYKFVWFSEQGAIIFIKLIL